MEKRQLFDNHNKPLSGPLILQPDIFRDERGFFFESWNRKIFQETTLKDINFVQDNHSYSQYGTLRGLHFQVYPEPQAKLVRCIRGEIYDVIVDLRMQSSSYGHWSGVRLDAINCKQLWIPDGFAHGFLVMSEEAEVIYKVSNYWHSNFERTLQWNDNEVAIDWPLKAKPKLSLKDLKGLSLSECKNANFFNHFEND